MRRFVCLSGSNIGATQPTYRCSLISTFVFHFLESINPDIQNFQDSWQSL